MEKKRGITIFSKQARLAWDDMDVTLLDTPGHVDFSAEMERVLQVLDYAVLVISGSDGVQGHTRTLWRLLARYGVPVFLFINKMDLAVESQPEARAEILKGLQEQLKENFVEMCIRDRITIPMMGSGIIAGAILSWVSIITEMSSGIILYSNRTMTLTIGTYAMINTALYGVAAVFATVTLIFTVLCLAVYLKFTKAEDIQI